MAETGYRPVFAQDAADFLLQLPKRRQRKVASLVREMAAHPHVRSDYSVTDESGRLIEHILIEDVVFAYWLDHAAREFRIVDLEDAS